MGESGVKPALAIGAAAVAVELALEPCLEAGGVGVANEVDEGVAEAQICGVAVFGDYFQEARPIFLRQWLYTRF